MGAILNVQIIALLFPLTVHKYVYPPVSKVHAGSFRVSVIHRTLTWTTGSLTCVCDHVTMSALEYIFVFCCMPSASASVHEMEVAYDNYVLRRL